MPSPETVILIPARYGSTRFPGKPLAPLAGAFGDEKTLIERSWRAAMAVRGYDAVFIATDDARIAAEARRFGAEVVMTSPDCANGTERCTDALSRLGFAPRVAINLQGDAPLTPPWFVEALIAAMGPGVDVATPVLRCTPEAHGRFLDDRAAGRVGGTTAVFDAAGDALYFSKEVIPFTGQRYAPGEVVPVFHHVGVYAYTPAALAAYGRWGVSKLETLEGLEQLRFLANGMAIRCVEVAAHGRDFWELNNPEDVPRIEAALKAEGIA